MQGDGTLGTTRPASTRLLIDGPRSGAAAAAAVAAAAAAAAAGTGAGGGSMTTGNGDGSGLWMPFLLVPDFFLFIWPRIRGN